MAVIQAVAVPSARAVIRTCIGCRQRVPVSDLLRVVVAVAAVRHVGGSSDRRRAVLPDPRRRAPGRGAWLHPVGRCLELAERRRAFGRALRSVDPLDYTALSQYIESFAGS